MKLGLLTAPFPTTPLMEVADWTAANGFGGTMVGALILTVLTSLLSSLGPRPSARSRASSAVAAAAAIVPVPRRSTKPARPSVSWSDPRARSAVITASAQAPIRTADSRAMGSSSASRNRRRWTTGSPGGMPRLMASAGEEGRMTRVNIRELGTRPARSISWENVIRRFARRYGGGSVTKLPRPGSRAMRPSSASRCMAFRAVIRLTPNSAHNSASEGSRAPGRRVEIRSRKACSIWR